MTLLSVNVNKIALLRNSRGRNYPDLLYFVRRFIDLGAQGITVHPRPDERHITRQDVIDIAALLVDFPDIEFNIEGYPSQRLLELVRQVRPDQCTLVPDAPSQLTSDHGWDIPENRELLSDVLGQLAKWQVRGSLFLDPDEEAAREAVGIGVDRVELYTEDYARAFGGRQQDAVLARYRAAADTAAAGGVGVNAGHDLNLDNLARFLQIEAIQEVSIGHALIVESLELGMERVMEQYRAITAPTGDGP